MESLLIRRKAQAGLVTLRDQAKYPSWQGDAFPRQYVDVRMGHGGRGSVKTLPLTLSMLGKIIFPDKEIGLALHAKRGKVFLSHMFNPSGVEPVAQHIRVNLGSKRDPINMYYSLPLDIIAKIIFLE